MNGQLTTEVLSNAWIWAGTKSQVLTQGTQTANETCIDICGSCYHWKLCSDLWQSHVGVKGPCCHGTQPQEAMVTTLVAAKDPIWVHVSAATRVTVDVSGLDQHQGPHGYLDSDLEPVAMLLSEGCAAVGARLIWVASASAEIIVSFGHGLCRGPCRSP